MIIEVESRSCSGETCMSVYILLSKDEPTVPFNPVTQTMNWHRQNEELSHMGAFLGLPVTIIICHEVAIVAVQEKIVLCH